MYIMGKTVIDDKKFDALLKDKQHKELKTLLGTIATSISNTEDKEIIKAIGSQTIKVSELIDELKIIKNELSTEEFAILTEKICSDIIESNNKVIDSIENRLLPDTFGLIKDEYGVTQLVKVNYKTAKEIKNN